MKKPNKVFVDSTTNIVDTVLDTAALMVRNKVPREDAINVVSALLNENGKRVERDTYQKAMNAITALNTNESFPLKGIGFGK